MEIAAFKSLWFHILLNCERSLFVGERVTQFLIKLPVFMEKKCLCLFIWQFCVSLIEGKKWKIFHIIDQCRSFFLGGGGMERERGRPWFSDDCVGKFLIWAAWVSSNYYLKEKQRFSVWSFTENTSFIPFLGGIWCRYSELK